MVDQQFIKNVPFITSFHDIHSKACISKKNYPIANLVFNVLLYILIADKRCKKKV